ncbi:4Fe-4S dicluster domain-containing protein [Candidatus Bipolaricaulota bacterium]|nr:4Fe-4S dicluster domain-containing protein [Candidatus Bipolaricaulota bacterium]
MGLSIPACELRPSFIAEVEQAFGQRVSECYQCGKCSAGCPVCVDMDFPPHQIVRGVQLGMEDVVLNSHSIWLCASCETCSTRCPQEVDLAGLMDVLRRMALAKGIKAPERDIPLFHAIFLSSLRRFGRIFELELMGMRNMRSGHFFKDVLLAPGIFLKGKLGLLPPRTRGRRGLRRAFAKIRDMERKTP